jgi:hypothetical protein
MERNTAVGALSALAHPGRLEIFRLPFLMAECCAGNAAMCGPLAAIASHAYAAEGRGC